MLPSARAADRSEDAGRAERHARTDKTGTAGRFAGLLDAAIGRAVPGPSAPALVVRRFGADGLQIFLAERTPAHLLAWQTAHGRRTHFADCVPLAGSHARAGWRATLVPDPASRGWPPPSTGLAVFDSDDLLARFEFAWLRGPAGWQIEPAGDAPGEALAGEFTPSPLDVEAVPAALRGAWPASCGRCRRYALGRSQIAPSIALCRRDCLPTVAPF